MKVCMEPVSTSATNVVPLMRTCSFMVLAMSMPVSACSDMPSSLAIVSGSLSSSISSRNTPFDVHLWSGVNFSV
jgi:hypothetical protein